MRSTVARFVNEGRRFLPCSLVPVVVSLRSRLARRRPAVWADAREQMRFVVGDDESDEVIDRLAAAYVKRSIWRGESRWHPSLVNRQQVEGAESLRSLAQAGGGLIVNFVHLGDYEGISPSLAAVGVPNHSVATSEAWDPEAPIWMKQQARVIASHDDVTLLDVAVGAAGIKELLSNGRVVAFAMDQPGHTPVRFLGHDLLLTSGAARIAMDTGVPVAVVTTHPDPVAPDSSGRFEVAAILDPGDFETVEAMLEVMVRRHERAFLDWPQAAEHPRRMLDRDLAMPARRHRAP